MISVNQAKALLEQHSHPLPLIKADLNHALGGVLGKDVASPVNLPPFNQSAMDGYAMLFSDYTGNKKIKIVGEVAAGNVFRKKLGSGEAVKIFTGAPVPAGADTVVMQEKVVVENGYLIINDASLQKGANIRITGSQVKKSEIALPKGTVLTPGGIGYLAAMGIHSVKVIAKPRIAVIVTGSELKASGNRLKKGQIYESNSYSLKAAANSLDIEIKKIFSVNDNEKAVRSALKKAINNSDVVLITGGISVGDYDFTGKALQQLGVKNIFYKVAQKPGKPLYFGKSRDTLVFGLPGNPAAVLSCFYEYVYPATRKMRGFNDDLRRIKLPVTANFSKKKGISVFLKGKTQNNAVLPLDGQESYILNSFAVADCLIYLPEESEGVQINEMVEVHMLPGLRNAES